MKRWPLIAGIASAGVVALFALLVAVSGEVWVPGRVWASGYYRGSIAYLMASAWLCLVAGLIFAGCMGSFPQRYFEHRLKRDISFVLFGALFLASTIIIAAKRFGHGAN